MPTSPLGIGRQPVLQNLWAQQQDGSFLCVTVSPGTFLIPLVHLVRDHRTFLEPKRKSGCPGWKWHCRSCRHSTVLTIPGCLQPWDLPGLPPAHSVPALGSAGDPPCTPGAQPEAPSLLCHCRSHTRCQGPALGLLQSRDCDKTDALCVRAQAWGYTCQGRMRNCGILEPTST